MYTYLYNFSRGKKLFTYRRLTPRRVAKIFKVSQSLAKKMLERATLRIDQVQGDQFETRRGSRCNQTHKTR